MNKIREITEKTPEKKYTLRGDENMKFTIVQIKQEIDNKTTIGREFYQIFAELYK